MTSFILSPLGICTVLACLLGCFCGLCLLLADEPVFTRAAFAELALMASKAMHRTDPKTLRERVREWWSRPEQLADLATPLDHEIASHRAPRPCGACTGEGGRCRCVDDCGEIQCSGERRQA